MIKTCRLVAWILLCLFSFSVCAKTRLANKKGLNLFTADNPNLQYVGRVDFQQPLKPRFWAAGVYIVAKFKGSECQVTLEDENATPNNHNYIEVIVDNLAPRHIKLTGKVNEINVADKLSGGRHKLVICKSTEAGIGYLELVNIKCKALLLPDPLPERKIEFIGNSITCGAAMDISSPCKVGEWYDHNNAYLSYGAATARGLNAQYHLTSVSGIGLMHSCCNMQATMPKVFDSINLHMNGIKWNFDAYQPDVVTVCLGQNDGVQDSTLFCGAYVDFLHSR